MQTDENKLLYMRARYYSTDLKRFINEDPEKDRINWYIYGNSNPVNYIDPEGTIPILAVVGIGLWAHSAYSFYRAAKSGDRFGMLMLGIGLIPGGKLFSAAGRAMRGLSSGARVLGGRVGTSLTRSLSGAVRSSSAKLSSIIKMASGSAVRTAPKIRVAGNGSRASVQSRLGGFRTGGNPVNVNPHNIRFSQSSVNGSQPIIDSMRSNGWKGAPIDIVKMADGIFTTVDNTRVFAAKEVGINVLANVHKATDTLPLDMVSRFTTRAGTPLTWGEAVLFRIGKQNATFRNNHPLGAFFLQSAK